MIGVGAAATCAIVESAGVSSIGVAGGWNSGNRCGNSRRGRGGSGTGGMNGAGAGAVRSASMAAGASRATRFRGFSTGSSFTFDIAVKIGDANGAGAATGAGAWPRARRRSARSRWMALRAASLALLPPVAPKWLCGAKLITGPPICARGAWRGAALFLPEFTLTLTTTLLLADALLFDLTLFFLGGITNKATGK